MLLKIIIKQLLLYLEINAFLVFKNILREGNMEVISGIFNGRYGVKLDYRIYMLISIPIYYIKTHGIACIRTSQTLILMVLLN